MFITFEGGEGCGKSTQIRLLAQHLKSQGIECVMTKEPGGTKSAEAIRALLLGDKQFSRIQEILLVTAARIDHVNKVIVPALRRGKVVLCDRFVHSTLAYQGFGDEAMCNEIMQLHEKFVDIVPDLTIVLHISAQEAMGRIANRKGNDQRFDNQPLQFHEKIKAIFEDMASKGLRSPSVAVEKLPNGAAYNCDIYNCVKLLDASGTKQQVHDKILSLIGHGTF